MDIFKFFRRIPPPGLYTYFFLVDDKPLNIKADDMQQAIDRMLEEVGPWRFNSVSVILKSANDPAKGYLKYPCKVYSISIFWICVEPIIV